MIADIPGWPIFCEFPSDIVAMTPGLGGTVIVQCVDAIYELHSSGFYRLLVDLEP